VFGWGSKWIGGEESDGLVDEVRTADLVSIFFTGMFWVSSKLWTDAWPRFDFDLCRERLFPTCFDFDLCREPLSPTFVVLSRTLLQEMSPCWNSPIKNNLPVRIDPPQSLVCCTRQTSGVVLQMKTEKLRPCVTAGVHDNNYFLLKGPERRAWALILQPFTAMWRLHTMKKTFKSGT
jgi:hypothetical protein